MGISENQEPAVKQKSAHADHADFVRTAYEAVLGRLPDPTGLNYYLSRLEAGISKAEVLHQLSRSREARSIGVKPLSGGWFTKKARLVQSHNPHDIPPSVAIPAMAAEDLLQMINQLGDQLHAVQGISEGMLHAVQGLQQASIRHEHAFVALHASSDEMNVLKSEVMVGLGSSIRGLEWSLRCHEKRFSSLRVELSDQLELENSRVRVETSALIQDQSTSIQADLNTLETRLASGLSELRGELQPLAAVLATHHMPSGLSPTAIIPLEAEMERLAAVLGSCDASSRTMGLKVDVLDQKSHWLSVDNDNIRKRIEFIRKEIMFEIRRVASQMEASIGPGISVGKTDKEEPLRNAFKFPVGEARRVNLGCGHLVLDGFVNVDARALDGVDIVADLRRLPFDPASIDELRATHVIEHFTEQSLRTEILPHWASVLRPGGTLTVTAPDVLAMMAGVVAETIEWDIAKTVLMGGQEYEGDFHFALLDPRTVCSLLEAAGFAAATVVVGARPNGDCLEFEVVATR